MSKFYTEIVQSLSKVLRRHDVSSNCQRTSLNTDKDIFAIKDIEIFVRRENKSKLWRELHF